MRNKTSRSQGTGRHNCSVTTCPSGARWRIRLKRGPLTDLTPAGPMRWRHSPFRSGQCGSSTVSGGIESAIEACRPARGLEPGDGMAHTVASPRSYVVTWSDRFNVPMKRIPTMNSLILLAALALVPFVPATSSSQNAGCGKCDCCGCCETGSCVCTSCTCVCCVDECPTAGLKAEQAGCCVSGCCSK